MAYTRLPLFLGILFAFILLISIEVSARDTPESAEENKVHVVKHLFGRNHHLCKHHGVGCKDYVYPQDGKDTTSEEVENKQGADAQDQAVEDNKVHVVKHLFGRNHHRCKHHGVGCKDYGYPQDGKDTTSEEVENKQGADAQDQAVEDNKVHVVKHLFGRNHHRCKHHGVGCKGYNPQEEKDTASEEVENTQGADAQKQAVEDNKVFGHLRHHYRCKNYGGPGCKQESPQAAGKEAANQEVENQGIVNTDEDQKDVSHGGGKD